MGFGGVITMLESLFEAIGTTDVSAYSSVLFNIYEDKDVFAIEASFDDDAFLIGREDPFEISSSGPTWEKVQKKVGKELEKYVKKNKEIYKEFNSIAYGFVDGDLIYIREPVKKKETKCFTADDFSDFSPSKLKAWLSVYLTSEANEKSWKEWFTVKFEDLSEEQLNHWRKFLADNFDYEKYRKNM